MSNPSSYQQRVINRMERCGYYYDEINSGPSNLQFRCKDESPFFPLTFKNWKDANEWCRQVVND